MLFDSTSETSTTVTTVSGGGSAASGKGSLTVASGAIGVSGKGAKYQEQGSISLDKSATLRLNSGNYSSIGGPLTVNNGDPAATQNLAETFADAIAKVSASSASATKSLAEQLNKPQKPVNGADGKAVPEEPTNWLALGAALASIAGALWLIFRKKTA